MRKLSQNKRKTQGSRMYHPMAGLLFLCMILSFLSVGIIASFAADEKQAPSVTVYVSQASGNDNTGDGSQGAPYQTLERAAKDLTAASNQGTVSSNKIILADDYALSESNLLEDVPVPVTITGKTADVTLTGATTGVNEFPLYLFEDLCLEAVRVKDVNHIYGNGHNITLGENVNNVLSFYLYGSGQNNLVGTGVGKISVKSGKISRIVGYVRSWPSIDVAGRAANITVGGTAHVDTIVAGSASGGVKNADVTITVTGGYVGSLIGGNQGFDTASSPFSGKTAINISGGTVNDVLGAGTGRTVSIPTYCGQMEINVTGGKVTNIYGAGSAAFVVSDTAASPSSVDISLTGGTVGNIFAAGRGGDTAVGESAGKTFPAATAPEDFGSLTGTANITVKGNAVVTGSIYASGEGYSANSYGQKNAYLKGKATITVSENSTVQGNVYGGGKGVSSAGFEDCARVTADSDVQVLIKDGTVLGNVYGGGQVAGVHGSSSVSLSGGTVKSNVYGGGENGQIDGKSQVNINGGTVEGSVYGGALGRTGERLVIGGSTVNMTGGWIRGNLYGGSELSDDGPSQGEPKDLVFVNLVGGTVSGNVFGGGYRGTVNGSTHLHIGMEAPSDCNYYQLHPEEKPALAASALSVGGSVYAGGDYGGGSTVDYTTITVKGTSHVYIDGTNYDTGGSAGLPEMVISNGVFGSGASCDAGLTRLVTLKNYGAPIRDSSGTVSGASRALTAIQRADRVLLNNAHVRLTGQSDVANANQTELYSLNRIGNHGKSDSLGALGNGLVLQGGSTVVLDSAAIETANLKSIDGNEAEVTLDRISTVPNTVRFQSGTVLRISYTPQGGSEIYGAVAGYAYMLADDTSEAYAYARVKTASANAGDGGFVSPGESTELEFHTVGDSYRYWQIKGKNAVAARQTVLTAQTLKAGDSGYHSDGFSVASGSIELPPAGEGHTYTISGITLPTGEMALVEAAKLGLSADWATSADNGGTAAAIDLAAQKNAILASPTNTFGLAMRIGRGFGSTQTAKGKVISPMSVTNAGPNTVIGQQTEASTDGSIPQIEFYLTYSNNITVSKSLGVVEISLTRDDGATTAINVEIVTKASALADQTVELYATQSGSYTGKLIIPSGASRSLKLTGVSSDSGSFTASGNLSGYAFSIAMQPVKSQGWSTTGLMTSPYDLAGYSANGGAVPIGTTDSRYQAALAFTLKNAPGFTAKEAPDTVKLTLTDGDDSFTITLTIHWKASVISAISAAPGKQYNAFSNQSNRVISQKSAVTASFTMGETVKASDLWLELRSDSAAACDLPAGARLTLLGLSEFYSYQVTGLETDGRLPLSDFQEMWDGRALTGNIAKDDVLKIIVDFGSADSALSLGHYSLRLRNETGADPQGADFTVNNNEMSAAATGGGGLSRGTQSFTLTVSSASDTRILDGVVVSLSLGSGKGFPEGVVFTCENKRYYPSGGSVYVPLPGTGSYQIDMDTTNTTGLAVGSYSLAASFYPVGQSAGAVTDVVNRIQSAPFLVTANPAYQLNVTLTEGNRIVKAGAVLPFQTEYSMENASAETDITVAVQKKLGTAYQDIDSWKVEGDTRAANGQGKPQLRITVPQGISPGTYRLLFRLGNEEVAFNIIVVL